MLPVLAPPPALALVLVLVLPTPPLPPCAEELLDDAPPAPLVVEEPVLSPLEQAAVAAVIHTSRAAAQERGEAEFIIGAMLRRNRQRTRGFLGPFRPFGAMTSL